MLFMTVSGTVKKWWFKKKKTKKLDIHSENEHDSQYHVESENQLKIVEERAEN